MFSCCTRPEVDENQEEEKSMRKIFSLRRQKKSKTSRSKRSSATMKPDANSKKTMSKRDQAEAFSSRMPKGPDFNTKLNDIVYKASIDEVDKDALRLIRRITLERKSKGQLEDKISFSEVDKLVPEEVKGDTSRESIYLFILFLNQLLEYFEEPSIANTLRDKIMDEFNNNAAVSVASLIETIGGDQTRTALLVKCLNQSVAITGHTHIKCNVCGLPTKDFPGERGWRITVTLAEYVQVKHTRRETNVDILRAGDDWEIEFDVAITFDSQMKEITNTKLVLTELEFIQVTGDDFKAYLTEKFGTGNLVIC